METHLSPEFLAKAKEDGFIINEYGLLSRYEGFEDEVIIPDGVEEIGMFAFGGNLFLQKVVIPDSVEIIWTSAFKSCPSLVSVSIGKGVSKIYDEAFSNCISLPSVIIPPEVYCIDMFAFSGCSSLNSVTFTDPGIILNDPLSIFIGCNNLKTVYAPEGLKLDEGDLPDGCRIIRQ